MEFESVYFEDYRLGATRETLGRTVTETDLVLHAGQTGDFYPHHVDEEWCKSRELGRRIAHGTLVFSLAVGLSAAQVNPEALSYGYDRLRFIRPVFIGDTLRARLTLAEKRPHRRPEFGLVVEKLEAVNQKGEIVLACEHLLLVRRHAV